jgi:hypothetical protein
LDSGDECDDATDEEDEEDEYGEEPEDDFSGEDDCSLNGDEVEPSAVHYQQT